MLLTKSSSEMTRNEFSTIFFSQMGGYGGYYLFLYKNIHAMKQNYFFSPKINRGDYLEDRSRTCKWLVSPRFISHECSFGRGPTTRSFEGLLTTWFLTTYWDGPPSRQPDLLDQPTIHSRRNGRCKSKGPRSAVRQTTWMLDLPLLRAPLGGNTWEWLVWLLVGPVLGCPGKGLLGSKVIGSMGSYTLLLKGIYWGYNPLILTLV